MGTDLKSIPITEGLDGDDSAGNRIVLRNRLLEKNLQGFPGRAAEVGKKLLIVKEVTTKDFRDAEDKMPVGNFLG